VGWGAAHAGREEGRVLGLGWPMRERGGEKEGWAGPRGFGLLLSLSFLFSFLYSLIQANLIEFKIQFEFKSINPTQTKQCCSMNAQTIYSYDNFYFLML
jgi:hypothetical protein